MRIKLKEVIKMVTPPVFIELAKGLRYLPASKIEWQYIPEGWSYAQSHPEVKGWDVQDILEVSKQKWPRFVEMIQSKGPLGVSHESDLTTSGDVITHNTMMAFGYALALAARGKDRLSILDWGGGIGHYYLLAQELLPDVEIEYHCKDIPVLAEYGAQLFPQQHFYVDESCFERQYDFVLASTSMHYTQDWQALLRKFACATMDYLYIANLPCVQKAPSFVFVQRPYQYGYNTEYLGWCLNRSELLRASEDAGLTLVREFIYGHQPVIRNAPEQNMYWGYLLRKHYEGNYEARN